MDRLQIWRTACLAGIACLLVLIYLFLTTAWNPARDLAVAWNEAQEEARKAQEYNELFERIERESREEERRSQEAIRQGQHD